MNKKHKTNKTGKNTVNRVQESLWIGLGLLLTIVMGPFIYYLCDSNIFVQLCDQINFQIIGAVIDWIIVLFVLLYLLPKLRITSEEFGLSNPARVLKKHALLILGFLVIGIFIIYPVSEALNSFLGIGQVGVMETYNTPMQWFVLIFVGIITAPIIEEILFRGFIISALNRYKQAFAILTSIIFFSLAHFLGYGWGSVIFTFFWSLLPTYLYVKTKSIYPGILLHILNNIFTFLLVSLIL